MRAAAMKTYEDLIKFAEDRKSACRDMLLKLEGSRPSAQYGSAVWRGRLAEAEVMLDAVVQAARNSKRKRAA
jgi:hypothetical protein